MKIIETKSAIQTFFYLALVDGKAAEDEKKKFEEIGLELDRKNFDSYKDEIYRQCLARVERGKADMAEYYDVIQEGVDEALRHETSEEDKGLTPRLLIWDLLAVAYINQQYDEAEKRLIRHVGRMTQVETSIIMDMEQLLQAAMAVEREKDWIIHTDLTYSEVKPVVDELEERREALLGAARVLIADEVILDAPFVYQPDIYEKAAKQIETYATPVMNAVGDKAKEAASVVAPIASQVVNAATDFFKGVTGLFGKKNETPKPEQADEGEPEVKE